MTAAVLATYTKESIGAEQTSKQAWVQRSCEFDIVSQSPCRTRSKLCEADCRRAFSTMEAFVAQAKNLAKVSNGAARRNVLDTLRNVQYSVKTPLDTVRES